MAAGMFLFSGVDTMAKFLTETIHPVQIVWCRQFGLLLGVLLLIALRGRSVLYSAHPKLQIGRGVLAACSATLFIGGVSYVPLADAVAITFVAPFMVTVFGSLILREPVGLRRWTAVTVGFLGTLIVIRPGMGVIHLAAGLIVIAATASRCSSGCRHRAKSSGNDYVSLSLAQHEFGPRRLYANLGRAAGAEDDNTFALIWNPQD